MEKGHTSKLLRLAPLLWVLCFLIIPYAIVFRISLAEAVFTAPPYTDIFKWIDNQTLLIQLTFKNYLLILGDPLYLKAFVNSIGLAMLSTLLTILLGLPFAYAISKSPREKRPLLLLMVVLPFWTSFLIRVYAWMAFIGDQGFFNQFIGLFGLGPFQILDTPIAVALGITYSYLPFMVLPLYTALEKLDPKLIEAAYDLGARPWTVFFRITLPRIRYGLMGGIFFVLIPAIGEFVIPELLGGSGTLMIGKLLWFEFFLNQDWPVASAIAILMLLILIGPIILFQKMQLQGNQ